MARPRFNYIHESHLDLFWIGDYRFCLERVDLLGVSLAPEPTSGDSAEVQVRPYEIVTMRARR